MINILDFSVQEITPPKAGGGLDVNSPVLPINWSLQAENYWILQDGQSAAIIFNGSVARRSRAANKEIPVGTVMCYAQGRLAIALPDRSSFRIGDLVFGSSGTPALGYRDAFLRFTENDYYAEGGDFVARVFGAPSTFGPILSMKAGAMTDSQLGQGPLIVGTPYMVFTVQLPFDRTTWKNLANALQTANPILGPLGQDSTILVNTDIYYRAIDGVRSYLTAQRQFNGSPGNTPLSNEVDDMLNFDTSELLEQGSAVLFDNRLLMTMSPVNSPWGVYHRGLVVLDFDLITNIREKLAPAWEGNWSGLRILKIVKGIVNRKERCFMYVLNPSNQIELWELTKNDMFDNGNVPIAWSVDLAGYDCGNGDDFKRLETGRIIVTDLVGTLNGTVKYRTDESPCYQPWDSFSVCAKYQDCGSVKATTTTAPFTVPALNGFVVANVTSTAGMSQFSAPITIGGFNFAISVVNSPTQVTIQNINNVAPGTVVPSAAVISFTGYDCAGPHSFREQVRTPIKLLQPADTFDPVSRRKYRTGYFMQPRLELNGHGIIEQFRLYTIEESESLSPELPRT